MAPSSPQDWSRAAAGLAWALARRPLCCAPSRYPLPLSGTLLSLTLSGEPSLAPGAASLDVHEYPGSLPGPVSHSVAAPGLFVGVLDGHWLSEVRVPISLESSQRSSGGKAGEGEAGGGRGAGPGLTSLLKSTWHSSSMPSRMLTWWNFLDTLRCRSRSRFTRELSMRPSTRWFWKAWEYWDRPMSFSQALATQ